MPKQLFCAQCGQELMFRQKALKHQHRIITVVEPHKCSETLYELPDGQVEEEFKPKMKENKPPNLDEMFRGFEFVKQINDLDSKDETEETYEPGDKRPDSQVKSSAPENLLKGLNNMPNSSINKVDKS